MILENEIIVTSKKQSRLIRDERAIGLAMLFTPENERLLAALRSFLEREAYYALLDIHDNDNERHTARGKRRMALTLIDQIKTEVEEALERSKNPPDKGENDGS